jgi:hypothetical protein
MIDIDQVDQISEWNEGDHGEEAYKIQAIVSKGDLLDIIDRLREAEKDAARYRWLRDRAHTVTGVTPCAFAMKDGDLMEDWNGQHGPLCMGALDAAVDEAMQCK